MFFSYDEEKIMKNFFELIDKDINKVYLLTFSNGDIAEAKVETCYETDNGLEDKDDEFEEYNACAVRILKIIANKSKTLELGKLMEINYHNCPWKIESLK